MLVTYHEWTILNTILNSFFCLMVHYKKYRTNLKLVCQSHCLLATLPSWLLWRWVLGLQRFPSKHSYVIEHVRKMDLRSQYGIWHQGPSAKNTQLSPSPPVPGSLPLPPRLTAPSLPGSLPPPFPAHCPLPSRLTAPSLPGSLPPPSPAQLTLLLPDHPCLIPRTVVWVTAPRSLWMRNIHDNSGLLSLL